MKKRASIPKNVMEILRNEVGFGCPVPNCGNPYLEYHHFDPPVHIAPHNNPKGMVALCAQHHKKADGNAYTVEQLHLLKGNKVNSSLVKGDLEWLRRDLLSIVGGNFYYETPIPVQIDGQNVISFKRDSDGYQRLSINMVSVLSEERIIIEDNSWENIGSPLDLRSPPQGKELEVNYHNGDYLYLRFHEVFDEMELKGKFGTDISFSNVCVFPITVVEIKFSIGGTNIDFSSTGTQALGLSAKNNLMVRCGVGLCINTDIKWEQNPKWILESKYDVLSDNVLKIKFGK